MQFMTYLYLVLRIKSVVFCTYYDGKCRSGKDYNKIPSKTIMTIHICYIDFLFKSYKIDFICYLYYEIKNSS